MASPEEIKHQQDLLTTYRNTLAHYLKQEAGLGKLHAPPGVAHGIREARENIQRIKKNLRDWHAEVADHPDDGDTPVIAPSAPTPVAATLPDKRALREALIGKFSLEELEALCADVEQDLASDGVTLQVNLDVVGGSGKPGKVLNLITYLDRRGYLSYLVDAARRTRPGLV